MSTPVLALCADASARMGTGHLMRCLALGRAWWNRGGDAIFITACRDQALLDRISAAGLESLHVDQAHPAPQDLEVTLRWLAQHHGAWLVLDGYQFDAEYQRAVKEAGASLLVVDDYVHAEHCYADVVVNQNIYAQALTYPCGPETVLLLGTRYALLSPDFEAWRTYRREVPAAARRILVTLGGGDPDNQTSKVIRALHRLAIPELEATVVVGDANPHVDSLRQALDGLEPAVHLVHGADNMPDLMAWADVAISAGGSTVWELAYMGLPNLVLVLAENQVRNAAELENAGAAINLGWFTGVSEEGLAQTLGDLVHDQARRAAMSHRGRELVDGQGCERVVSALVGEKAKVVPR